MKNKFFTREFVPVGIYKGALEIDMKHISDWVENMQADEETERREPRA